MICQSACSSCSQATSSSSRSVWLRTSSVRDGTRHSVRHPADRRAACRRDAGFGRMGAMSGSYWKQVRVRRARGPDGPPARRPHRRADPDAGLAPTRRSATAPPTRRWPPGSTAGVYDDLLAGLGDGMAAGLGVGLGERDTDSVFRRSFSALVLAECIARDNDRPLLPRRQDPRVGRPGRDLAAARARPARLRARQGLGARRRPRRRRARHAGRSRRTSADHRADRAARRDRRPGAAAGRPARSPPASPTGWRWRRWRCCAATSSRCGCSSPGSPGSPPRAGTRASYDDRDPYLDRRQRRGVPAGAATSSSRSAPEPPEVRSDLLLVAGATRCAATNPHVPRTAAQPAVTLGRPCMSRRP